MTEMRVLVHLFLVIFFIVGCKTRTSKLSNNAIVIPTAVCDAVAVACQEAHPVSNISKVETAEDFVRSQNPEADKIMEEFRRGFLTADGNEILADIDITTCGHRNVLLSQLFNQIDDVKPVSQLTMLTGIGLEEAYHTNLIVSINNRLYIADALEGFIDKDAYLDSISGVAFFSHGKTVTGTKNFVGQNKAVFRQQLNQLEFKLKEGTLTSLKFDSKEVERSVAALFHWREGVKSAAARMNEIYDKAIIVNNQYQVDENALAKLDDDFGRLRNEVILLNNRWLDDNYESLYKKNFSEFESLVKAMGCERS